jgi:hypothetical protein
VFQGQALKRKMMEKKIYCYAIKRTKEMSGDCSTLDKKVIMWNFFVITLHGIGETKYILFWKSSVN